MTEPTYEVVWPLGKSVYDRVRLASRAPDLRGKTICELWDWRFRGEEVFPILSHGHPPLRRPILVKGLLSQISIADKGAKNMGIKFKHLAISCPDPHATAKLYARLFNMKVVPAKHVSEDAAVTDGDINITFITPRVAANTVTKIPVGDGFAIHHLGFTVPSVSEFRAQAEKEGCVVVKEYETFEIMKFQDPNGLIFDVAAEDHWSLD